MRVWGFFILILISNMTIAMAQAESHPGKNVTEVNVFTTQEPHSAEFFKDYLYIADGNSLLIYNTSNPEKPTFVNKFSDFNEPGRVLGLSISEEELYIAAGPGWIYVLNISDPEKPKNMYQINNLNVANDVAIAGENMYIADANTGLLIFNLTDRKNPGLVGMFYILRSNLSGSLQGWGGIAVAVSENYAFLSGEQRKGFYIIDITDPSRPREVFHSIGKNVYDISLSESGVYLARADGTTQFDLLNVSNPYMPQIVDIFSILESTDRSAIAIHPSGNYIYAASGYTWHIFKIKDTLPPELLIEKPMTGDTFTDQIINVSGTAFDKSGISEVQVNGKFAGTETWSRIIELVEGINNITITALDKNGNNISERIQVTYHPSLTPSILTPAQTVNVTPAATSINEKGENIRKSRLFGILFVLIFIASMVLFYLVRKHKIKK